MKKWKKQRAQQKNKELKQIQVGVASAKNDLEVKVKKLEEFLGKLKREGYSCIHTPLEKGPSAYVEANYVMSTCMIYAQRI